MASQRQIGKTVFYPWLIDFAIIIAIRSADTSKTERGDNLINHIAAEHKSTIFAMEWDHRTVACGAQAALEGAFQS